MMDASTTGGGAGGGTGGGASIDASTTGGGAGGGEAGVSDSGTPDGGICVDLGVSCYPTVSVCCGGRVCTPTDAGLYKCQ